MTNFLLPHIASSFEIDHLILFPQRPKKKMNKNKKIEMLLEKAVRQTEAKSSIDFLFNIRYAFWGATGNSTLVFGIKKKDIPWQTLLNNSRTKKFRVTSASTQRFHLHF